MENRDGKAEKDTKKRMARTTLNSFEQRLLADLIREKVRFKLKQYNPLMRDNEIAKKHLLYEYVFRALSSEKRKRLISHLIDTGSLDFNEGIVLALKIKLSEELQQKTIQYKKNGGPQDRDILNESFKKTLVKSLEVIEDLEEENNDLKKALISRFQSWEGFIKGMKNNDRREAVNVVNTRKILIPILITFDIPYDNYDQANIIFKEENETDNEYKMNSFPNKSHYYIGYFFSDRYELKKCLLEIDENHNSVNLYYVEPKDDGSSEIRMGEGEHYTGTIESNRAIALHKGNQFSHIILAEDYHLLSDDVNKLSKYQAISALWQKERLKLYETSSNLLLKRIKDGNLETLDNSSISLAEISKLLSWRYDKLPYKLNNEKYKEEVKRKSVVLSQLPGKYEIYQYLTVKKFSRFILEISENLEISLQPTLHGGEIDKRGYMKVYSRDCNPIVLHFPPMIDEQDLISIALNRNYRNNPTIMTGSIWEINNGKPFCGKVYAKKIVEPANCGIPRWLEIKDILLETQNKDEYPDFIDYFIGNSAYHNCMVSYDAYDDLKKEVEQFKKNQNE